MGGPLKNRLNGQVFAEGVYYPTLAGAYGGTSYGFISIAQLPVHTHTCQGAPTGITATAGGPTGITGGAPTGVTTNNIVAGHSMYSKVTGITVTLDGVFVRSGSGQGSGDAVGVHGSEGEPLGEPLEPSDGDVLTLASGPSAGTHAMTATVHDPGHWHNVLVPAHKHDVSDPWHAHSFYDPWHTHTIATTGTGAGVSDHRRRS